MQDKNCASALKKNVHAKSVLVPLPVHYIAIFVLVFDLLKFVYADPCPSDSCLARSRQRPSLPIQPCRIQRGGLSPLLKHEATALERLHDGAPPLRLGDEARVDVGGRVGLNDDAHGGEEEAGAAPRARDERARAKVTVRLDVPYADAYAEVRETSLPIVDLQSPPAPAEKAWTISFFLTRCRVTWRHSEDGCESGLCRFMVAFSECRRKPRSRHLLCNERIRSTARPTFQARARPRVACGPSTQSRPFHRELVL